MNTCRIRSSRRSSLPMIVIALLLSVVGSAELHAQHQRAAGVFFGVSQPEKRVIWHGLVDTTVRVSGFSIGAAYEISFSENLTMVLMPQYSVVSLRGGVQNPNPTAPGKPHAYIELYTPGMYSLELPVSIRGGTDLKGLHPYVSLGVTLGYAFSEDAIYYQQGNASGPDPQFDVVRTSALGRIHVAVQGGAGISVHLTDRLSLWTDWSLTKHLNDPIDSDLVTWEAPLRGIWRFGLMFPFEGGGQ